MGSLYTVTANDKSKNGALTVLECDRIALKQGGIVIAGFGYGYACPKGGPVNAEYESIVINKQGMGNHGEILLRGRTSRARALLRQGKINRLIESGCPNWLAPIVLNYRSGMEDGVWKAVQILVENWPPGEIRGPRGPGYARFLAWFGLPGWEPAISFPRMCIAYSIAEKVLFGAEERQNEQYGIDKT